MQGWLVHGRSRCSPLKEGNSLRGPSNSPDACFGVTYRVRPTSRRRNTIIHAGGNIAVICSSLFSFLTCRFRLNLVLYEDTPSNLLVWKEKQMESRWTRLIPLLIFFDVFSFLSEARLYLCYNGNRKENTSILFDTVIYLWVCDRASYHPPHS